MDSYSSPCVSIPSKALLSADSCFHWEVAPIFDSATADSCCHMYLWLRLVHWKGLIDSLGQRGYRIARCCPGLSAGSLLHSIAIRLLLDTAAAAAAVR
jgi:hypothetical protein